VARDEKGGTQVESGNMICCVSAASAIAFRPSTVGCWVLFGIPLSADIWCSAFVCLDARLFYVRGFGVSGRSS
jgi:hypothetical protein